VRGGGPPLRKHLSPRWELYTFAVPGLVVNVWSRVGVSHCCGISGKRILATEGRKALRARVPGAFEEVLLSPAFLTFIGTQLRAEGFSGLALDVSLAPSINGLFLLCLGAWTLDWIAQGGAEKAARTKLVNDGMDLLYVMYGLLGRDLVAADNKALRLFRSLRSRLVG
jgi:hypothetical protein